MIDIVDFRSLLGPLGLIVDRLLLQTYMERFLSNRGKNLKLIAEEFSR